MVQTTQCSNGMFEADGPCGDLRSIYLNPHPYGSNFQLRQEYSDVSAAKEWMCAD